MCRIKKQFEELIGAPINYLEMYNASEGFFAGQDDISKEGMLLMCDHGIFYGRLCQLFNL